MKLTLSGIDDQIREVENRIAVERIALDDAIHESVDSLRETITSPKALVALAGVGFAVGKVMFRSRNAKSPPAAVKKKGGVAGLLTGVAGAALSLAGSRWTSIATWGARKYFERKKAGAGATPAAGFKGSASPRSQGSGASPL